MADDRPTPAEIKMGYLNKKQDSGFLTDLLMSIYDAIAGGEPDPTVYSEQERPYYKPPQNLGQSMTNVGSILEVAASRAKSDAPRHLGLNLSEGLTPGERRRMPINPPTSLLDSIIGGLSDAALFSDSKDRFYNRNPQTVSDAITNAASILEVAASRAKGAAPKHLIGQGLPQNDNTPGARRRTPQGPNAVDPLFAGIMDWLSRPSQAPGNLNTVRGLPPKQEGPMPADPGFLSSLLDSIMTAGDDALAFMQGISEPDPRAAMQPEPQAPSNDLIAQLAPPMTSAMPMGTSMNPLSTADLQALSSPGTLTFSSNPDGTISSGQGFTGQGSFSKGGPTKDVFYERLFGNSARQSQFAQQKAQQVQELNAQINQMRQIQDQWYSKRRDPALVQLVTDTFGSISNMEKSMEIKADMARAAQYEAQRAAKRQQEIAAIIGQ